jgi:poly [ADP-ribose] polymerase 2/3/4
MLNQTNIGQNNNKYVVNVRHVRYPCMLTRRRYYVIQLLHPIGNNSQCILYTRWGRVGESGQSQKKGPFPSTTAISEFKKQFKAKAATDWSARVGMTAKPGEWPYFWTGHPAHLV